MNDISVMTEATRVYLNLNGVVLPYSRPPAADSDVYRQNGTYWWRPGVLRRLGSLSTEIVLSSTWGEDFISTPSAHPQRPLLELFHPTRALSGVVMSKSKKTRTVCEDIQASPAPFVWVDDHAPSRSQEKMLAEVCDGAVPYLIITPDGQQGLLHTHVDQIEAFAAAIDLAQATPE